MATLIFRDPLIFQEGTGFTITPANTELFGKQSRTITFSIGQAVATTSNVEFNEVTSSNLITLNNDNFIPGMGTPFAMISNKSLLIIGSNRFFDDDLELSYNLLFNLEEQGQLLGFNLEYLLNDNWFFNVSANYFIGNDDPINSFEQLEDFSNTQLQLSYTF